MSFMLFFGHGDLILFHFIVQRIGHNTYQHRIAHIQLRTCSINSFIRTIESLMNQLVELLFTGGKTFRFFFFT